LEAVEDITSNIQAAQAAVTAAPPLAAKPGQLREQLEASKYILVYTGTAHLYSFISKLL